jgi:hypothetical protein
MGFVTTGILKNLSCSGALIFFPEKHRCTTKKLAVRPVSGVRLFVREVFKEHATLVYIDEVYAPTYSTPTKDTPYTQ